MKTRPQKFLTIPILFLVIGFAIFIFVKSNKPGQPSVNTNSTTTESLSIEQPFDFENKQTGVEFKNLIPNNSVSKQFSLYEVDPYQEYFPSAKLAKDIGKILELKQIDENNWQDETYTVSYLPEDFYIKIKIKSKNMAKDNLSEDEMINRTEEYIKRLNIWPYYTRDVATQVQVFEKPNIEGTMAIIIFREKIEDHQVYTNILRNAEIYTEMSRAGEITEIRYFYVPYKKKEKEMEIKTVQEIQMSLEKGKYKRIDNTIDFTKIYIDEIENIYYASPDSLYIQPMFLVKGENEFAESIEVLVPAMRD
ncbi:hypothetical protein JW796_00650 [Candidatus Dojkabacteria bacterium]|nr:hypothetical protein [Candidatus Dojkabacteria bacterium]